MHACMYVCMDSDNHSSGSLKRRCIVIKTKMLVFKVDRVRKHVGIIERDANERPSFYDGNKVSKHASRSQYSRTTSIDQSIIIFSPAHQKRVRWL